MNDTSKTNFRYASNLSDCEQIHSMLNELSPINQLTPAYLKTDLDNGAFIALILTNPCDGDTVMGCCLLYHRPSFLNATVILALKNLHVRETFRRQGIGRSILDHIKSTAKQKRILKVMWTVYGSNTAARTFYHKLGAYNMTAQFGTTAHGFPDVRTAKLVDTPAGIHITQVTADRLVTIAEAMRQEMNIQLPHNSTAEFFRKLEHFKGKCFGFEMRSVDEHASDVIGGMFAYQGYNTEVRSLLVIDFIYIKPQHRRKGFGKTLLHEGMRFAKENNLFWVHWWFDIPRMPHMEAFSKAIGAKNLTDTDDWLEYGLDI